MCAQVTLNITKPFVETCTRFLNECQSAQQLLNTAIADLDSLRESTDEENANLFDHWDSHPSIDSMIQGRDGHEARIKSWEELVRTTQTVGDRLFREMGNLEPVCKMPQEQLSMMVTAHCPAF